MLNSVDLIQKFYSEQLENWQLLQSNVAALAKANYRKFSFGDFEFVLQHNPERITSTSAVVSPEAIKNRKCFLCKENRPDEQKEFLYKSDFLILANPYPILQEHLTIASINHMDQLIEQNFSLLLEITKDLGEKYSIYYNGPRCGASAPDHLHFQAGQKNFLPIENNFDSLKNKFFRNIWNENDGKIFSIENLLRNGVVFESNNSAQLNRWFNKTVIALKNIFNETIEPKMNILSLFNEGFWRVIIFPRQAHRPEEYFTDGGNKILISPAVIDLGGLLIAPRKEDFEKLTAFDIKKIFQQVMLKNSDHQTFIENLTNILQQ